MATIRTEIDIWGDVPPTSNFPTKDVFSGSNFPVKVLAFDASTEETTYYFFQALGYGSGNITCKVQWYADTGSSGDVIWGAQLAAITPNTDSQDIETKAFATAQTATDTHLGTTNQRLHEIDITVSNLDSVAAGDWCCLKLYRNAAAGGDTMAGDALLAGLMLSWSDT